LGRTRNTQILEEAVPDGHDDKCANLQRSGTRLIKSALFASQKQKGIPCPQVMPAEKHRLQSKANIGDNALNGAWKRLHSQMLELWD